MGKEMGFDELKIHVGNMAFRLWERLPEPKLPYVSWWYGERKQSLSESIEGYKEVQDGAGNLHDEQ